MAELGRAALAVTLGLSLYALVAGGIAAVRGRRRLAVSARNALIARASFGLIAIGNSFGTLSEVALGRKYGKLVIGMEGAAEVEGVVHVATPREAVERMAGAALGVG